MVERDATRLAQVAVIRLCGPFGKHALPCIDWPADMKDLILGHHALVKGGLEGMPELVVPSPFSDVS